MEPSLTAVKCLGNAVVQQREEFARTVSCNDCTSSMCAWADCSYDQVLNLFVAKGYEMTGLATLLKDEIASLGMVHNRLPRGSLEDLWIYAENYNTIFRGNSLATKAVDQYMKMVGMEYLHNTIGPLVKAVVKSKDSCEVGDVQICKLENSDLT